MFTSRVNERLSPCACGNKEIVVEYDHEEDNWCALCWVCMKITDVTETEEDAVKLWEQENGEV